MIKEFCFSDVKKYLKEENDTIILDAFDKFADVAIIFHLYCLDQVFYLC